VEVIMPGFDFVCPMNYPSKCVLSQTEVDYLTQKEGYKRGFLMYQFRDQDGYLIKTIKSYFNPRNCQIFEAAGEPGAGVKICKVCKLATASHFGIAVLSPENLNVHLEIGLVWGQGKPILFIVNEKKLGKKVSDVAFDVSDYMLINYKTKNELSEGLEREGPAFIEKVEVFGQYQQALVESIREKLKRLREKNKNLIAFLRMILLLGKSEFGSRFIETYIRETFGSGHPFQAKRESNMNILGNFGFLEIVKARKLGYDEAYRYSLSETLLPILRQEAFKEID
jgi:hypothetical protein